MILFLPPSSISCDAHFNLFNIPASQYKKYNILILTVDSIISPTLHYRPFGLSCSSLYTVSLVLLLIEDSFFYLLLLLHISSVPDIFICPVSHCTKFYWSCSSLQIVLVLLYIVDNSNCPAFYSNSFFGIVPPVK